MFIKVHVWADWVEKNEMAKAKISYAMTSPEKTEQFQTVRISLEEPWEVLKQIYQFFVDNNI